MAAISRRTVFYEKGSDGEIRWHDWAMVNTNIGMMLEPRAVVNPFFDAGNSGQVRNWKDDITRVDDIVVMSLDRAATLLSDTPVVGGYLVNRTNR